MNISQMRIQRDICVGINHLTVWSANLVKKNIIVLNIYLSPYSPYSPYEFKDRVGLACQLNLVQKIIYLECYC